MTAAARAVPHRRVVALARYGMAGKAMVLRRHPEPRRLATLVATGRSLETKAVDDALELFDVVMTNDLMARAARESRNEKLAPVGALHKDGARRSAASQAAVKAGGHQHGRPPSTLELFVRCTDAGTSRSRTCAPDPRVGARAPGRGGR
jgi:hypothetical protein